MNAVDDWYDISRMADRSYSIKEAGIYGMYLIEGTERSVLIDTGLGIGDLWDLVTKLVDAPITVLLTHTHWDHIGAAAQFDEMFVSPIELPTNGYVTINSISDEFTHRPEEFVNQWIAADNEFPNSFEPDKYTIEPFEAAAVPIEDGITLGNRSLDIYPLPGHSPGHLGILDPKTKILYGGDVIHIDRDLYILFENCTLNDYIKSLFKLKNLRDRGIFDVLVTSNNETISGSELSLIDDLLEGLREIAAGEREYEVIKTTWGKARSYQIGSSKVLTKTTI